MSLQQLLMGLRLAFRSTLAHLLRSLLTILGIVLGVASVILMLAVGEGVKHEAIQQIQDLGATNLIVRSIKPLDDDHKDKSGNLLLTYGLTVRDLECITATVPTVKAATPMREFRKEIRHLDHQIETRLVGCMPNFLELNGLHISVGRFFLPRDNQQLANVCVLGAEAADILFPLENPLGRVVSVVGGHDYTVVGVTERRAPSAGVGGSLSGQDYNRDFYIPFATDQARFGTLLINFQKGNIGIEKLEISQLTISVDRMENVKETAHIIEGILAGFHKQKDTAITIPLDLLEKAEQTQRLFTLVLGAIASIALLVGGIGIMNIMLATVTERTREIGIRRALGAKRSHIILQFLLEATVLSSIGGIVGVSLGMGLSFAVTHFIHLQTIIRPWSPLLAFVVSVAVGLVFGTYPARRAARMDPIEALRHE